MFDLYTLGHYNKLEQLTTLFNVLMPIICVLLTVTALILLTKFVKSEKAQKITKLVMAGVLLLFALIKPIFWLVRSATVYATNGAFNSSYIVKAFGFNVNFYLTILLVIVLVYSALAKKQNKFIDWFKYTVLGIALPLGVINLINPKLIIDINDSWYHIVNLSSIIVNLAYIIYPIYLVTLKDVSFKLNKFWQAICGYVCICCLCMTLSLILGKSISSMLSLDSHLLIVNLKIGFPWHLLVIFPAFLLIAFGIYWLGHFVTKLISKENTQTISQTPKNEFFDLYTFATKSIASMQGFLILIIVALITRRPLGSAFGILGLIPFVMEIFCMLAIFEMEKLLNVVDDNLFTEGNPTTKRILTYVFIGNFIFGFAVLHQLKNERLIIEERKQREEKKKQKELQSATTEEQATEEAIEESIEEPVKEINEESTKEQTTEETVSEEVEENNETTENE